MDKLGIRMDGTQDRFIALFLQQVARFGDAFSLFELGTAEGFTFGGLCKVLNTDGLVGNTKMVSCDLPDGWSTDSTKLTNNMRASGMKWSVQFNDDAEPTSGAATIYMVDGRVLIKRLHAKGFSPSFVFIDGCHGSHCVKADFLAVESSVPVGGIVCLHDAGELEQGTDYQNHCQEPINVRAAIKSLGLLDGSRQGWRFAEEVFGDRVRGGEGNSHIVVERVAT